MRSAMTPRPQPPNRAASNRAASPAQRDTPFERVADSLRELRHADSAIRQVDLCLGQRRLLHRQPWRQPLRRPGEPVSVLESIRRFEARARLH